MEPAPANGEWIETDFSAEDQGGSEIVDPGLSVLCSAWHSVNDDRVVIGLDSHDPTHGRRSMAMPIAQCDSLRAPTNLPSTVIFTHFNGTWSNPLASLVTARFYLQDEAGEPVPYLASSSFVIRHGFNCRELQGGSDDGRAEGSVDIAPGQRFFGSTKFITALFDTSDSVTPPEMQHVLRTFIEGMRGQRGDIYVKLVGFGGQTEQLTLTQDCVEDFCLVGHDNIGPQDEWNILSARVDNYPQLLEEFSLVAHGTNFYESMLIAAQEFKIASRVRAALIAQEPGYLPPSATTEHLVVFSDCVESVHVTPLAFREMQPEDPHWHPGFSYRRDLFATIQQGDLSSAISLIYLDPPSEDTGSVSGGLNSAELQSLEGDIDELSHSLKHVYHARNVAELAGVFLRMSEQIDREANAWYEMTFCPPERSGDGIFLQIQSVDHGGALETHYNAHGFQNTCADSAAFAQSETSSLCERNECGFLVC
eukprot:SAG31_NODE_1671_length_7565_cov_7.868203_7_plen_479_part_00